MLKIPGGKTMENNLICPKCKGFLNIGGNIIFSTRQKNGKTGLILLHEQFGNYTVTKHANYNYESGEHVSFFCPLCHAKLKSDAHENFATIQMIDKNNQVFNVYFSEIADEKSTFVLVGDNIEIYGKDSESYINFFNLAQTL